MREREREREIENERKRQNKRLRGERERYRDIYIYIYIYRERERERKKKRENEKKRERQAGRQTETETVTNTHADRHRCLKVCEQMNGRIDGKMFVLDVEPRSTTAARSRQRSLRFSRNVPLPFISLTVVIFGKEMWAGGSVRSLHGPRPLR